MSENPDELHKCAKRRCGHTYKNSETVWVLRSDGITRDGTCPLCSHDVYTIPRQKKGRRPA